MPFASGAKGKYLQLNYLLTGYHFAIVNQFILLSAIHGYTLQGQVVRQFRFYYSTG